MKKKQRTFEEFFNFIPAKKKDYDYYYQKCKEAFEQNNLRMAEYYRRKAHEKKEE